MPNVHPSKTWHVGGVAVLEFLPGDDINGALHYAWVYHLHQKVPVTFTFNGTLINFGYSTSK